MSENEKCNDSATEFQPSHEEIRAALTAVLSSKVFSTSPRLQEFLRYVVEETLSERDGHIKGKTIAVDVYHRDLINDGGAQNLVRVEARRLRRSLTDYYETEGGSDPLRIQIASGGYRPSFTTQGPNSTSTPEVIGRLAGLPRRVWFTLLIVGTVVTLTIVAALVVKQDEDLSIKNRRAEAAIREALRERSVPALQANNLAQQARGLVFPIFDAKRQHLALEMFRHVIQLDPGITQGYAGAAQILSTLSLITKNEEDASKFSDEARVLIDQALDLDPSNAWAHAALGWTLANSGEFKDALKHARLAFELAPEDGYVLDLVGMAGIVAQEPGLAARASDPDRPRSGSGRFGARNIWGVSQYMLGDYTATIKAFSGAASDGAPVSPPSLIFLAVAYDHLGYDGEAQQLVEELSETWPEFPAGFLMRRIFHDGSVYERDILQRLGKYGYDFNLE